MYHFLEMCEHVKTYGITVSSAKVPNEILKAMFFGIVEKNNVFVFQPIHK